MAGVPRRGAARPRRRVRLLAGGRCEGQRAAGPGRRGREAGAAGALHGTPGGDFRGEAGGQGGQRAALPRSDEHTSELPSLMRISYAVFCWKKQKAQIVTPVTTAQL